MVADPWLPVGFELPAGQVLGRFVDSGPDWQIYSTKGDGKALCVVDSLATRWCESGLMDDSTFQKITFGSDIFSVLHSDGDRVLSSVFGSSAPKNKSDALAFVTSLAATRKLDESTPLHDAIYAEQYTRLLPTYSVSVAEPDDVVLGTWLTGGVHVSVNSTRRMNALLGWMGKSNVSDVLFRTRSGDRSDTAGEPSTSKSRQTAAEKIDGGESSVGSSTEVLGEFRLPGRPELEVLFNEHVLDIVREPDRYKVFGIDFPTAIALHGPPGCGKTFAVEKLVEHLDWPIFTVDANSIASPYIHDTTKKVAEIFDKAIDASPSVIVIDEMESYLSNRQGDGGSGQHHVEEVAEFLRRIPEANENKVLVIGMTNRIDIIDPAILRRGRFDHIVEVSMPSAAEIGAALKEMLANIPCDDAIDISSLAVALEGQPLSDAAYLVRESGRNAARAGKSRVDQECLSSALQLIPSRTEKERSRPIGFIWNE